MKIHHNILFFSSAVFFLFSAKTISAERAKDDPSFDGSYVGVTIGMGTNSISTNSVFWVGPNDNKMNPTVASQSFNFSGILGYGWDLKQRFYVGAEAQAGYDSLSSHTSLTVPNTAQYIFDMKIKKNFFTGIAARTGYLFNREQFLLFTRLGVDFGWYRATLSTSSPLIPGISGTKNGNFCAISIVPGLGVETILENHITLRFEYDYEIGMTSKTFSFAPSKGISNSLRYKPSSGIIRAGIGYKF